MSNQQAGSMMYRPRTLAIHFVLLKLVADWTYVRVVTPMFSYAGFALEVDFRRQLFSYVLATCVGLVLARKSDRPSQFLLSILAIFILMPMMTLWSLGGESGAFLLQCMCGFVVIRLFIVIPTVSLPILAPGRRILLLSGAVIAVVFLSIYFARGGYRYFSLDIGETYAIRPQFEAAVFAGYFSYLARWFSKIVIVAMIAVSLIRRNRTLLLGSMLIGFSSYFLTTAREQLVYPIVPFGLLYLYNRGRSWNEWLILAVVGAIAFGYALYEFAEEIAILGFFAVRAFFVIGQNHYLYYEYFQDSPFVMFSQNLLSWYYDYPYSQPVAAIIGENRFGESDSFSNTGLFASGYMQAGFAGLLFYSVLAGLLIWTIDCLIKKRMPIWAGASVGFVAIYQLVNVDLLTALLTHGVGFSLLVLFLMGGDDSRALERKR